MSELMLDEIHEEKRIKVRSAEIVVRRTLEKPYYEIKYQTADGEWHIGYSSRKLEHVFWLLDNCFEIISYEQEIRNKAIDELSCKLMMYFADCQLIEENAIVRDILDGVIERIDEIAERLKGE